MTNSDAPPIRYVGFWARAFAFLIDNVAGAVLTTPFLGAFLTIDIDRLADPVYLNELQIKIYLALVLMAVLIIALWKYFAATPGKLLIKAYIVNASDLHTASNIQLLIRALGYIPSFFIFGLGFVWIGLDQRKQGWHDKMARTLVVHQKPIADDA